MAHSAEDQLAEHGVKLDAAQDRIAELERELEEYRSLHGPALASLVVRVAKAERERDEARKRIDSLRPHLREPLVGWKCSEDGEMTDPVFGIATSRAEESTRPRETLGSPADAPCASCRGTRMTFDGCTCLFCNGTGRASLAPPSRPLPGQNSTER